MRNSRIRPLVGGFVFMAVYALLGAPPAYAQSCGSMDFYCHQDTDNDGFPDDVDQCPNEPGTDNGCPRNTFCEGANYVAFAAGSVAFVAGLAASGVVSAPVALPTAVLAGLVALGAGTVSLACTLGGH